VLSSLAGLVSAGPACALLLSFAGLVKTGEMKACH